MTSNQIAYWSLQEQIRANKAKEDENKRSNVARETETNRSNIAKERETLRSNLVNEQLKSDDTASQIKYRQDQTTIQQVNAGSKGLDSLSKIGGMIAKLFI